MVTVVAHVLRVVLLVQVRAQEHVLLVKDVGVAELLEHGLLLEVADGIFRVLLRSRGGLGEALRRLLIVLLQLIFVGCLGLFNLVLQLEHLVGQLLLHVHQAAHFRHRLLLELHQLEHLGRVQAIWLILLLVGSLRRLGHILAGRLRKLDLVLDTLQHDLQLMLVVRAGSLGVSIVDHGLDHSQQLVQVSVARRSILLLDLTQEAASVLQLVAYHRYHFIILRVWIPELIMVNG